MKGASLKRILPVLLAAALLFAAGCADKPAQGDDPEEIIDVGSCTPEPGVTNTPTEAPTPVPDTLEGKILAGLVYPLNFGEPASASFRAESVDIDGDGAPELLSVEDVDGGPVFCIDGEAFLDVGSVISLASLDGKNIYFISETPGRDGFFVFHPDYEGNLFCRLFGIGRKGSFAEVVSAAGDASKGEGSSEIGFGVTPPSALPAETEALIRAGLDVMLHDPLLYSSVEGAVRTVRLDMDGDGEKETIVFDSETLSINGVEDRLILTTTMPRFVFDPERNTIVLYGSAGDTAIRLWVENGEVKFDQSYTTLL